MKLVKHLVTNKHCTPLEHCVFSFRVKAPIFVARQWFRHRMGSFNERSLRYCEARPEFYYPSGIGFELWDGYDFSYKESLDFYHDLLEGGATKEQARAVLPLGIYTEFIWTVNASSLFNFLRLRLDKHAQLEIREYAKIILQIAKQMAPITFGYIEEDIYGRQRYEDMAANREVQAAGADDQPSVGCDEFKVQKMWRKSGVCIPQQFTNSDEV